LPDKIFFFLKNREKRYSYKFDKISTSLKKISLYRFLIFLFLLLSLIIYYIQRDFLLISFLPIITVIIFIYLIHKYNKVSKTYSKIDSMLQLLKREELRYELKISELYREDPDFLEPSNFHFWKDLDIFGKQGLYSYLDTTVTQGGNKKFVHELLQKVVPNLSDINYKQTIIKELSTRKKLIWKLLYLFYETSPSGGYVKVLLKHNIESVKQIISIPKQSLFFIKLFLIIGYIGGFLLFLLDKPGLWGFFFFTQILLYSLKFKKKNIIIKKYEKFISILTKFEDISLYLSKVKFTSDGLKNKFNRLSNKDLSNLFIRIKKLETKLVYREIPLPGFLLNVFFSFDYFILNDIHEIENSNIPIDELTESLDYLDSILPFTLLQFYNQNLEFPEFLKSLELSASEIGHPLIPNNRRVYNKLSNVKPGSVVLITGSNMSGKTTFLRTIGINVLLAHCGAPVCAKSMKLSPMKILSSIKNEDSLSEGVSFFYSEVQKLSYILRESKTNNSLLLIDEVLKGTNTRERLIATKSLLQSLSEINSINYITTHDIELAKESSSIVLKHFTEIVENDKMSFDYLIRDGVITSGNALKILSIECPELRLFLN
jgi:ABC-type multidrug transport system fused ATPase/permease subunit